jgi:hypothetical protein
MTHRYWFDRRSADSTARPMPHTVQPVSWEGWACIAACASLIGLGALMWVDAASQGLSGGWMGLVFLTVVGGGALFAAAGAKTDPDHTAADYRSGRVNTNSDGSKNA